MTAARPDPGRGIAALGALIFLAELVMLAELAWAGARLAPGVFAVVLAVSGEREIAVVAGVVTCLLVVVGERRAIN